MSTTSARKAYNIYERRQAIPIIYVRGTHYDIGFDVVSLLLSLVLLFMWLLPMKVKNLLWLELVGTMPNLFRLNDRWLVLMSFGVTYREKKLWFIDVENVEI